MSDEFDKYQREEPAAAPVQEPASPFSDEKTGPPAPSPSSRGMNLLILAGIAVIVVGAGTLVLLGPRFSLHKPAPPPKEPEQVRILRIVNKWEALAPAARQAAIPDLVHSFRLDDESLRLAVMLTLTNAGKDPVAPLVAALGDEDYNVRFYAAWTLGRIGPDAAAAVPALIQSRSDLNGDVRRKVVFALGRIHPPADRAMPVLVGFFEDDDVDVRQAAVEALAGYGKEALPALLKALNDPNPVVRRQAVLTVAEIGPDAGSALSALRPLYLDPATGVQDEAAVALSRLGKPAVPVLAQPLATDPAAPPGQVVLGLGSPWALLGVWRDYAAEHRRALAALGAIGPDALDVLLAALKNPNADVRQQAVGMLGELGYRDRRIILPLVETLRDPEDVVRQQAGWTLQQLLPDAREMLPGLRLALNDKDADVRFNTVSFLGLLGTPAVPLLVEGLKDRDEKVQVQAVKALHELKTENDYLLASIEPLLKDADPRVRRNAVSVLHRCGSPALEPLIAALKDKDLKVRQQAIQAVATIPGDPKLLQPALTEALTDEDAFVRGRATAALGRIAGVRAVPQLQQALMDKDDEVRLEAVEALLTLNPNFPPVLTSLLPALQDKSAKVRRVVVAGLARFHAAAIPHLIQALKDDDDEVWKQAKNTLIAIEVPDKAIFPPLVKALKDENSGVRQGACLALQRFKAEAVPYLVQALKDPDPNVQFKAADSLDDIGPPARKAIPALVETATTNPNEKVRRYAVMALVTIQGFDEYKRDPAKAVPDLIKLLSDPDVETRWGAVQTLAALGPPAKEALAPLQKLLNDPDPSVSAGAQFAIQRIQGK